MQEATASAVEHVAASYFGTGEIERRRGTLHWSRFFRVGQCRDGYMMHCTLGDWTSLIEWVNGDGKAQNLTTDLTAPEWEDVPSGARTPSICSTFSTNGSRITRATSCWSARNCCACPMPRCATPKICSTTSNSWRAAIFAEVEHPELGRTFRYPGAPYLFMARRGA